MLLNKKELLKSLKVAKKYAEKKAQDKITANIFFIQEDGELMLKASNGEIGISIDLGVVENAINFDVNLLELLDFVAICNDDNISFDVHGNDVHISSGASNIILNMFEVNEKTIENYMQDELKNSSVAKIIKENIEINENIFKSIDRYNPKIELNGMLLDLKNKKIVSTDTRRMSINSIDIDYKGLMDEVIIPRAALQDVKSISDIKISQNYISFKADDKIITTRQIIGEYPSYDRIISFDYNFKIMVNGLELKNYLKKIKDNDIVLHFINNAMTIKTSNGGSFNMECYYPSNNEFIFSCDKRYLSDSILVNEIQICINDSNLPFTIEQNGGKQQTVIMPIRDAYDCATQSIKRDFIENSYKFTYKEIIKKRKSPVNKDKIIRDLKSEILQLQEKLKKYEDKNSVVKSEIFNNIFNNCKSIGA